MSGLAQSVKKGYETYSPTWRNLLKLFIDAGLDPDACFYTNFIMGVRQNSDRNTGPSPAMAHPAYMQACAALFLEQLQLQQPRLIITLGMVPFKLLALVSTDLRYRALGIEEFKDLDAREVHINANVEFDDARRTTTTVVPLCHPCQPLNGRRRSFPHTDLYSNEAAMLMCATDTYAPSAALIGAARKEQAYSSLDAPVDVD
jgi:uracil-DNA glycosylase